MTTPADRFTTYALIDLDALEDNVRAIRAHVGPAVQVIAVVKANAYGHGAVPVARAALAAGAARLAVARVDEGIALRRAGIDAPILILGYSVPGEAEDIVRYGLIPAVTSIEAAQAISARAQAAGRQVTIHVKVDSGMGRYGLLADEAIPFLEQVTALPALDFEGMFTHFATADSRDKLYTRQQFAMFLSVLNTARETGYPIRTAHAANSAAALDLPMTHLDAVRIGIAMYGLRPSDEVAPAVPLRAVLSLRSHAARVRTLPAGASVGYGRAFIAQRPTTVALVSVGYGDGYPRSLSGRGQMLIRGQRAPVVGRVSMDQTVVDVTGIDGVAENDEVVLIGAQGEGRVTAEQVAALGGTINYEVTTALHARIPRVYLHGGEVVETTTLWSTDHT